MVNFFKKSLIFACALSLLGSSCSLKKNNIEEKINVEENNQIAKPEIIKNPINKPINKPIDEPIAPNKKEVSSRGKVLCFERSKQEDNAFLSETAYKNCLLTIDKNLEEYDEKQADLYFIEKKEEKKISKPQSEMKTVKNKKKKKKKKKKKNNKSKVVNTKKDENSCKEGSIAGGVIGAGIGAFTAKGKNKFWAVPAGGAAGALIGCQIDGG